MPRSTSCSDRCCRATSSSPIRSAGRSAPPSGWSTPCRWIGSCWASRCCRCSAWPRRSGRSLVIVDDAHLVDDGSLAVLSFVARRLDADRIAIVYGLRRDRPAAALAGFPVLSLSGLPDAVVEELLRERTGVPVDASVASRLVAATGGSPLAIVEIGGLLSEDQLAGRDELPDPLPIGDRLEAHFDDIVRSLPEPGRRLLLVAAAASAPADHGFVAAAATRLDCWPEGLDPAERAGLLHLDPMPRFRHPLVRSVIYAGSPAEERRNAHRALAESATDAGDVVRAAWHLGLATSEPDEAVAARLEAVADDALERGGCGMAAAFRARAAVLTPDRSMRVGRCVAAAQNLLLSGSPARARDLLAELVPDLDDQVQRGVAQRLHGQVRYATGEATGTVSVLIAAAEDLRDVDRPLARDTLLDGLSAAQLAGSSPQPGESYADVARVARGMPLLPGAEPTVADRLLDAATAVHLDGAAAARPLLLAALAAVEAHGTSLDAQGRPTEQVRWLGLGCWTAGALADDVTLLGPRPPSGRRRPAPWRAGLVVGGAAAPRDGPPGPRAPPGGPGPPGRAHRAAGGHGLAGRLRRAPLPFVERRRRRSPHRGGSRRGAGVVAPPRLDARVLGLRGIRPRPRSRSLRRGARPRAAHLLGEPVARPRRLPEPDRGGGARRRGRARRPRPPRT